MTDYDFDDDIVKGVELTEAGAFLLYRAMAAEALIAQGFKDDAWKATAAFDFSFQEILCHDLELWDAIITCDAVEYKAMHPEYFN